MTLLRILTGVHAGAELRLPPGMHRVGREEECDILLTDWCAENWVLNVDAHGIVTAQRAQAMQQAGDEPAGQAGWSVSGERLRELVPVQFGDTIVCVGPHDSAWPSDVELLSRLLAAVPGVERGGVKRPSSRYSAAALSSVVLGVAIVACSLGVTTTLAHTTLDRGSEGGVQRVSEALSAAHMMGLTARAVGDTMMVVGMVDTPEEDDAVRTLLARVAPKGTTRNYDIAQNDARSIEDSLGSAGVRVHYRGAGSFVVTGTVDSRADLEVAVARVRADLDSNVREIVLQVVEKDKAANPDGTGERYSEMIDSNHVRYAQTTDGVKHAYATDGTTGIDAGTGHPFPGQGGVF